MGDNVLLPRGNSRVAHLIRYTISGTIAAFAHLATLVVLVESTGLNATLASAVGFLVACYVNYTIQYRWVFRADGSRLVSGARYIVVTTGSLLVNVLLFWLLHEQFDIWYPVAQVFAIGVVFLLNFYLNRHFTFRVST